jgi:hypothetical protein
MQEGGGKLSHKSNKIATTPTRGPFAVVTPSTKASKREQANAKKIKQVKKRGWKPFLARDHGYQAHRGRALLSMRSYNEERIGALTSRGWTICTYLNWLL